MNPMERELIERLLDTLEKANSHAESVVSIDERIDHINSSLTSIDRMLRGFENSPGLVMRVAVLERTHNTIRVLLGAFAGAFVTLLAAYIGKH